MNVVSLSRYMQFPCRAEATTPKPSLISNTDMGPDTLRRLLKVERRVVGLTALRLTPYRPAPNRSCQISATRLTIISALCRNLLVALNTFILSDRDFLVSSTVSYAPCSNTSPYVYVCESAWEAFVRLHGSFPLPRPPRNQIVITFVSSPP